MKNYSRIKLIFKRWLDLVLMSALGGLIFILASPALDYIGKYIVRYLGDLHWVFYYLIATATVVIVWYFLIRLGGFRVHDLYCWRNSFRNPPVWLWSIFATIFIIYLWPYIWGQEEIILTRPYWPDVMQVAVVMVPGVLLALIMSYRCGRKEEVYEKPLTLEEWIEREEPIKYPEDDRFGMTIIARRIANKLRQTPLKTIGLIGPYGNGKSSILNLVEYYLDNPDEINKQKQNDQTRVKENNDKIIICNAGEWGVKQEGVAEHILRAAVKKLARHVDCVGLANLPVNYHAALDNSGNTWLSIFANLLNNYEDPIEVLKEMDEVLERARIKMVIFLEDIDRNIRPEEYLSSIAELLDRLKGLSNVSFVLAIGENKGTNAVLDRILEHREKVHPLSRENVIEIFQKFRDLCLGMHKDDIYCQTLDQSNKRLGIHQYLNESPHRLLSYDSNKVIDSIFKLLSTPRIAKLAFRRTLSAWKSLHGEIDFDDLLMANILRATTDRTISFINDNIILLQNAESGNVKTGGKEDIAFKSIWDNYMEGKILDFDEKAALNLIHTMFPGTNDWSANDASVQGIASSHNVDYLKRLFNEELAFSEISDQSVLSSIEKWKGNNKAKDLASAMLEEDGFAGMIEQFGYKLNGDEVLQLAQQLFSLIMNGKGKRRNPFGHYDDFSGFIELWNLSLKKPVDGHRKWVLAEIKKALPVSLRFANDIYYYWGDLKGRAYDLDSETDMGIKELRDGMIDEAKRVYDDAESLIRAIEPEFRKSICDFMVVYSSQKQGGDGFEPADWQWMADILLDAAKKEPGAIVPQIIPLIFDMKATNEGYNISFNEQVAEKLFKGRVNEIMNIISQDKDERGFDKEDMELDSFARKYAKDWIKNEGENEDPSKPATGGFEIV